jgi:hypothetical protein
VWCLTQLHARIHHNNQKSCLLRLLVSNLVVGFVTYGSRWVATLTVHHLECFQSLGGHPTPPRRRLNATNSARCRAESRCWESRLGMILRNMCNASYSFRYFINLRNASNHWLLRSPSSLSFLAPLSHIALSTQPRQHHVHDNQFAGKANHLRCHQWST